MKIDARAEMQKLTRLYVGEVVYRPVRGFGLKVENIPYEVVAARQDGFVRVRLVGTYGPNPNWYEPCVFTRMRRAAP